MKSALLVVVSLAVSILFFEAALRVVGEPYPEFNGLHPVYGWKPRAGIEGRNAFEGDGWMRINQAGFRDVDHAVQKPDDVFRVAVLGDSFTEAREVDLDETYWKQLEMGLQGCVPAGRTVEVMNFAVNGYGTAQQRLVLEREVLTYRPDAVLLAVFTGNDIWNNSRALDGHRDRPFFDLKDGTLVLDRSNLDTAEFDVRRRWADVKHWFYNRMRSVQLGRKVYVALRYGRADPSADVLDQLNAGLEPGAHHAPRDDAWRDAWTVTDRLIAHIVETVTAAGADPWIATLSTPIQVFPDPAVRQRFAAQIDGGDLTYADDRIAALAQDLSVPVVTMVRDLRAMAERDGINLHGQGAFAGGHWNVRGHNAAAQLLIPRFCAAYGG